MSPLHQTRATADVLLDIDDASAVRWRCRGRPSTKCWLRRSRRSLPRLLVRTPGRPQEKGGWWGTLPPASLLPPPQRRPSARLRSPSRSFDGDVGEYPFHFLPYASSAFLDGSLATFHGAGDAGSADVGDVEQLAEINPATAARLGIGQGT